MTQRTIANVYNSEPTSDGDGVKINRVAIRGNLAALDPFLLLDEIASDEAADYIGGFPPHPHRGFETVTYMLEGAFTHTDHMGNKGHLRSGGVQWMTAGKGVIHSEMPEQEEGRLHGFQLWVNLPAKDKMQPARYQEFEPEDVPEVELEGGGLVRVVAGAFNGTLGPVAQVATNPSYFDIRLPAGKTVEIDTILGHNSLFFMYKGEVEIQGANVKKGQLAQLTDGDRVMLHANEDVGLIFLSAKPIREPVANYGPFVMNTQAEIEQAILDYNNGTLTD